MNDAMRIRGLLSIALGIVGAALELLPWLYFDQPGRGAVLMTCFGAIFVGVARADVLSDIVGADGKLTVGGVGGVKLGLVLQ
jgi:hypothetical protein